MNEVGKREINEMLNKFCGFFFFLFLKPHGAYYYFPPKTFVFLKKKYTKEIKIKIRNVVLIPGLVCTLNIGAPPPLPPISPGRSLPFRDFLSDLVGKRVLRLIMKINIKTKK